MSDANDRSIRAFERVLARVASSRRAASHARSRRGVPARARRARGALDDRHRARIRDDDAPIRDDDLDDLAARDALDDDARSARSTAAKSRRESALESRHRRARFDGDDREWIRDDDATRRRCARRIRISRRGVADEDGVRVRRVRRGLAAVAGTVPGVQELGHDEGDRAGADLGRRRGEGERGRRGGRASGGADGGERDDARERERARTRDGRLAFESADDVLLVAAGGSGLYSYVFPTWCAGANRNRAVTRPIDIGQACAIPER